MTRSTDACLDERWFQPGGVVPVDMVTTGLLVREILRLREEIDTLNDRPLAWEFDV